MNYVQWLSGFNIVLDASILLMLVTYLISFFHERFQFHYCIAFGLTSYISGQMCRNLAFWMTFITESELHQPGHIAFLPVVASPLHVSGSLLAGFGLTKLIHSFGAPYFGNWIWVLALFLAILAPLIAIELI